MEENRSLGLVPLPEKTFEHDLAVGDRYQNFSAELLRLSLAGIGAVGFLIVNMVLAQSTNGRVELLLTHTIFGGGIFFSLLLFGTAAAFALAHRFVGTESQALHIKYLRRLIRKSEGDDLKSKSAKAARDKFFASSGKMLFYSGISLWAGAMVLIISFYPVLFKFRDF